MKCSKCGTEFEEGIFCPECGTRQAANITSVTAETHTEDKNHEIEIEKHKTEQEKFASERAKHEAELAKTNLEMQRIEAEKLEQEKQKQKTEQERLAYERTKHEAELAKANLEMQRLEMEKAEQDKQRQMEEAARQSIIDKDNNAIEQLKKQLLSTNKQEERRKILDEYSGTFETEIGQNRFDALKEKAKTEKPKYIKVTSIWGYAALISFVLGVIASSVKLDVVASCLSMIWFVAFIVWIVRKIMFIFKKNSPDFYLNIKKI